MSLLLSALFKSALVLGGLCLATASFNARADRAPNLDGSCPSGYTKGTNTAGKARCYSPSDRAHQQKQQQKKSGKS